jgi:hypothetical protein
MKVIRIGGTLVGVLAIVATGLYLTGYGELLAGKAFLAYNSPTQAFDPADAVVAPDYHNPKNWSALPESRDPADLVPTSLEATSQGSLPIDTFFIHPTGFLKSTSWTSSMDPDSGTEENTRWMMANQASAYNGCCNVYAPRYREATIISYFGDPNLRDEVLGFAYQDVKNAFKYYLENYNQGRPFIIASHSQGSHHAMRLLSELVDSSELHKRMVAAYLIGSIVIPVSPAWLASMSNITACQNADDLHCVVHWDTMPEGAPPLERSEPSLCTNPLTWQVNEAMAGAELNEGAVVPAGTYNTSFGRGEDSLTGQIFESLGAPLKAHTWARCQAGSLYVANQEGTGFEAMGSGNMGSYHGLDYALFYMNIRSNAQHRSALYLETLIPR